MHSHFKSSYGFGSTQADEIHFGATPHVACPTQVNAMPADALATSGASK